MQRYENRRLKQVLRRLRKNLCLCARGESSESGSEYVAKDASTTSASPAPSFVTAQQNECSPREETTSLHSIAVVHQLTTTVSHSTAPTDQLTTTGDHSTATTEQFPTTMEQCTATNDLQSPTKEIITDESSSSVELPTSNEYEAPVTEDIDANEHDSLERTKEQVNTGIAQSSVVPVQAEIDEASADHLLIREVEEFVKMLMDCFVNGMNAEDTTKDVAELLCTSPDLMLAPDLIGVSTVESSVTEFYSCHSESIRTNTSLFCSLTSFPSIEEDSKTTSFPSIKEDPKTKDCRETLLTPHQSSEEQENDASMPQLEACTEEVSFFSLEDEASREECGCNGPEVMESTQKSGCTAVVTDGQLPCPDFPTKVTLEKRSESCLFQVTLVQGLMGVGLTLGNDDLKEVAIKKIRMFSPAAIQGQLRIGDRILEINGQSVIGKSHSQAQAMLSQTKWGEEVTILAMPPQETVVFHFSEAANAGVITMKLNTSFDKPLGVDIEGGSDTECPYIRISAIKCGSVADRCGMLRVGDELLEIDQHLMVGTTHREAIDVLGHISSPITLTVQRRENLNLKDRIQLDKN